MYTVGIWFVHLMNIAILAIVGVIVLGYIQAKKGQYLREAATQIQCEIKMPTGHDEYYTVPLEVSAEWVEIKGVKYNLPKGKEVKNWGMHPRLPFMGLRSLQVQIRKCTWYFNNPNPFYRDDKTPEVTAAEIGAMSKEATAVAAGVAAVELKSQQEQMIKAIANQPDKTVVYVGIIAAVIGIIAVGIMNWQLAQKVTQLTQSLIGG